MIGAIGKRVADPRGRLIQSAALWSKIPMRTIYPQASSNIISGMPRNRIPFAQKVMGGLFIASCVLGTPAWIITHLDDYRGGPAVAN